MLFRALGLVATVLLATITDPALGLTQSSPDPTDVAAVPTQANDLEGLWVHEGRPTAFAEEAIEVIATAPSHGLRRDDYPIERLVVLRESMQLDSTEVTLEFEQLISESFSRFVQAMRTGESRSLRASQPATRQRHIPLDAIHAGGPSALYASLVPRNPQYQKLQRVLSEYEQRFAFAEVGRITIGPSLEIGDFGQRVTELRERLLGRNDPAYGEYEYQHFDELLEQALKAYQNLHGLEADGIVGPQTIRHLNMSGAERVARVKLALARWRKLPADLGRSYVQVNIPEFRMQLVRGREQLLSMRVVVGSRRHQTPEINDEIERMVFNPFWHVPTSIAVNEILPQAQQDPAYLRANDYDIIADGKLVAAESIDWNAVWQSDLPFRVRQRPGANNALGSVKFLLPNPQNIYLHDSPSTHLYASSMRAFSHGCIRLEYPEQLAVALLELEEEWTEARISSTIGSGKRRQVNLTEPLPVYLTYHTVKITDSGEVAFFNDIYGRDQREIARLL